LGSVTTIYNNIDSYRRPSSFIQTWDWHLGGTAIRLCNNYVALHEDSQWRIYTCDLEELNFKGKIAYNYVK